MRSAPFVDRPPEWCKILKVQRRIKTYPSIVELGLQPGKFALFFVLRSKHAQLLGPQRALIQVSRWFLLVARLSEIQTGLRTFLHQQRLVEIEPLSASVSMKKAWAMPREDFCQRNSLRHLHGKELIGQVKERKTWVDVQGDSVFFKRRAWAVLPVHSSAGA